MDCIIKAEEMQEATVKKHSDLPNFWKFVEETLGGRETDHDNKNEPVSRTEQQETDRHRADTE